MEMVVMIVVLTMVIVVVKMVDVVIGVLLTHLVRDSPFLSLPLPYPFLHVYKRTWNYEFLSSTHV